jgi:hypothetical protein
MVGGRVDRGIAAVYATAMEAFDEKTPVAAMSWKQWSATLVASLCWPVTMLLLAWIFREPVSRLIGAITTAILR